MCFSFLGLSCFVLFFSSNILTFDRDVSGQTLLLPAAPALSRAHVVPLVLQPHGLGGEVRHPAVGVLLEEELALEGFGVQVNAAAVQLLRLGSLVLQGLLVEAVPLQLVVGVVVGAAAQGHSVLLQRRLRGSNVHAEALRDGFKGENQPVRGSRGCFVLYSDEKAFFKRSIHPKHNNKK